MKLSFALLTATLLSAAAFMPPAGRPNVLHPSSSTRSMGRGGPVYQTAVDITFPGNKKVKGKPGESLKALAEKARYNCPYGCEEGKCGTCEHVGSDGKKYRVCIAKVPKTDKPLTLKQ